MAPRFARSWRGVVLLADLIRESEKSFELKLCVLTVIRRASHPVFKIDPRIVIGAGNESVAIAEILRSQVGDARFPVITHLAVEIDVPDESDIK
jgi:hypothetical protein